MPYVTGFLNVRESGSIDNSLPGSQPGIDNSLPGGLPPMIDNALPLPPPGVWPPLTPGNPIRPVRPDNSLPSGGAGGGHPDHGLPGSGGQPDNTLPLQPGVIWPPIPGARDKYLVLVVIPGVGWRYTVIDASLSADNTLPSHPTHPDQGLPGSQPHPDQGLPGSGAKPDQGLPPTPQPKK